MVKTKIVVNKEDKAAPFAPKFIINGKFIIILIIAPPHVILALRFGIPKPFKIVAPILKNGRIKPQKANKTTID